MAVILLVRHGENSWVKEHRLAGWTPGVHLNEQGHAQAQALAERLAHLPIKAIYSSPLVRCWETAEYIANAHQLSIIESAEMGEVRYGLWEGAEIKDLSQKKEWHAVQFFPSRFQFPEGESLREVQQRAVNQLEKLAVIHAEEMIVVASHADVLKLVLAHYLGVHIDLFQRIGLSPASVSVIALHPHGGVQVQRINDDGLIKAPAAPTISAESSQKEPTNGEV